MTVGVRIDGRWSPKRFKQVVFLELKDGTHPSVSEELESVVDVHSRSKSGCHEVTRAWGPAVGYCAVGGG